MLSRLQHSYTILCSLRFSIVNEWLISPKKGFRINTVARRTSISKYLAEIGRKGGKASSKGRMEKLTPEQRVAVAKTAAAARWAKPITQADLTRQADLQAAEWEVDRMAQMGAEEINIRLEGGATVNPGKLTFDVKHKRVTASKKVAGSPAKPAPKIRE